MVEAVFIVSAVEMVAGICKSVYMGERKIFMWVLFGAFCSIELASCVYVSVTILTASVADRVLQSALIVAVASDIILLLGEAAWVGGFVIAQYSQEFESKNITKAQRKRRWILLSFGVVSMVVIGAPTAVAYLRRNKSASPVVWTELSFWTQALVWAVALLPMLLGGLTFCVVTARRVSHSTTGVVERYTLLLSRLLFLFLLLLWMVTGFVFAIFAIKWAATRSSQIFVDLLLVSTPPVVSSVFALFKAFAQREAQQSTTLPFGHSVAEVLGLERFLKLEVESDTKSSPTEATQDLEV